MNSLPFFFFVPEIYIDIYVYPRLCLPSWEQKGEGEGEGERVRQNKKA